MVVVVVVYALGLALVAAKRRRVKIAAALVAVDDALDMRWLLDGAKTNK